MCQFSRHLGDWRDFSLVFYCLRGLDFSIFVQKFPAPRSTRSKQCVTVTIRYSTLKDAYKLINKTEIPSVSKMTRKLTHSTFIENSLQSLNSYLMTIPRKRQFWQSLMTKSTIPNFPLWQSLIRNLTILISPNDHL